MLAEAGVKPPTTMDELVAAARKLAKYDAGGKLVRSGLSLRLSGQGSGVTEKWWTFLLQHGKSLIRETSPGKYRIEYNGPEGVKTFQMYVDLLQSGALTLTIDSDAKAFENGSTAMFVREPWVIADIAKNAPQLVGKYGTISLPKAEIGVPNFTYVPAASANQACAWEFARFLTERDQQLSFAKIGGWLPVRVDLDFSEFLGANPAYDGFLKKPAGYTFDYYATFPEFDEIATKLADRLVKGYADYANLAGRPDRIQASLDTWASETTSILRQSGRLAP
jgi:multiple sugar transport system substrate-binding protein